MNSKTWIQRAVGEPRPIQRIGPVVSRRNSSATGEKTRGVGSIHVVWQEETHPLLDLFKKWANQPDTQSTDDWEKVKESLDINRLSDRKLFTDENDHP